MISGLRDVYDMGMGRIVRTAGQQQIRNVVEHGREPIKYVVDNGSTFRFVGTNIAAVEAEMQAAGSGAQAIVYGWRTGEPYAHFFNVINQKGTVRFVDGQAGGAARLVYDHYQVMLLPNP